MGQGWVGVEVRGKVRVEVRVGLELGWLSLGSGRIKVRVGVGLR